MEMKGGKLMENVPFSRFSGEDQKFLATCRDQRVKQDLITSVNGENEDQ
jgi:hypothetical protein